MMARNKFVDILRYIRLDDKRRRARRRENDKYAPIRDLRKTVMNNLQKSFFPHGEVTIDEELFPRSIGQGAVLSNICQGNLQNSALSFGCCVM